MSARTFPNLDAKAEEHLEAFIAHFVSSNRQRRWRSILAMKPHKWVGVSADDCTVDPQSWGNTPAFTTLQSAGLAPYLDTPAFVFHIGHGAGGAEAGSLRSALLSEHPALECVVSVLPGKLAVCYGHSNEVRICKR